jgi:hypothetical protein
VLLACRKGQECITLLRDELGIELADVHVPLRNGGVLLHKLQGVMHDTCNTANKTARLAKSLRDTSGRLHFGFNEWELRTEEDKHGLIFYAATTPVTCQWMPLIGNSRPIYVGL